MQQINLLIILTKQINFSIVTIIILARVFCNYSLN